MGGLHPPFPSWPSASLSAGGVWLHPAIPIAQASPWKINKSKQGQAARNPLIFNIMAAVGVDRELLSLSLSLSLYIYISYIYMYIHIYPPCLQALLVCVGSGNNAWWLVAPQAIFVWRTVHVEIQLSFVSQRIPKALLETTSRSAQCATLAELWECAITLHVQRCLHDDIIYVLCTHGSLYLYNGAQMRCILIIYTYKHV